MGKGEIRFVVAKQDEVIVPFGEFGIVGLGFEASVVLVNAMVGCEAGQYRWRIYRGEFSFRKMVAPNAMREAWLRKFSDCSKPELLEVAPMPGARLFKGIRLPGSTLSSVQSCTVSTAQSHGVSVWNTCQGVWCPSAVYELIGSYTAGPGLVLRGAEPPHEPNFSVTRRRQELLEMALSYALSNCADLAQAMAYEGPENEQLVICGSRIYAAPTEEEFGDLLEAVTFVDDIKTLPE